MTIEGTLTAGQLLAVIVSLSLGLTGAAWGLIRLVAAQFSARMDLKFEALAKEVKARDDRIDRLEEDNKRNERELYEFRLKVQEKYMTHEDRIELASSLKGRMDGLAGQLQELLNVTRR